MITGHVINSSSCGIYSIILVPNPSTILTGRCLTDKCLWMISTLQNLNKCDKMYRKTDIRGGTGDWPESYQNNILFYGLDKRIINIFIRNKQRLYFDFVAFHPIRTMVNKVLLPSNIGVKSSSRLL